MERMCEWKHLAQDRNQLETLLNRVMSLPVLKTAKEFTDQPREL
jgi:hypothetical protein